MNVVWSGTTRRPTTATNGPFLNGNDIQLKACAANAATKIGMMVAGIVMNRLLTSPLPMSVWSRILALLSGAETSGTS